MVYEAYKINAEFESTGIKKLIKLFAYLKEMVNGVVAHEAELDEIISAYSTKRVINRIPKINLSILRLALYEIRYDAQMPMNAAIAEAISLAKAYGYQEDISFINGVLGNYARDHAKDTGTEQHA